jgi:hypothetical protein
MASICLNGLHCFAVPPERFTLPDAFTILDLERIILGELTLTDKSVKSIKILDCYYNGSKLDRRDQNEFVKSQYDFKKHTLVVRAILKREAAPLPKEDEKETLADKKKGGNSKKGKKMDAEGENLPTVVSKTENKQNRMIDPKVLQRMGAEPSIVEAKTPEEQRSKIVEYIRTYNQLRELEDRNLENKSSIKYSSKGEAFRKIVNLLRQDDIGGYIYGDAKGYDLEQLIQVATDLEGKQMEVDDWAELYKYLIDYYD